MFAQSLAVRVLPVAALLVGSLAHADKMPFGFAEVGNRLIHTVTPTAEVQDACAALEKIYQVEDGYRGCTQGVGNSMTVMMARRLQINRIWNKMLNRGDAGLEAGRAVFYYNQTNYKSNYAHFGRMALTEGQTGTIRVQGGRPQFIVGYMVSVHKACSIAQSGVTKADPRARIQGTKLVNTTRKGDSIQHHYEVNGGQGTEILAITATLSTGRVFFVNNCEVNVYADYGDDQTPPIIE